MIKVKEDMTGWIMSEHGVPESKLTVIARAEDKTELSGKKKPYWLCQCSCGSKPIIVAQCHIKSGHTKTCGHNKRKNNKYDLSGEYGIGWTTNTNREFYFDLEDYDKIKNYKWSEHSPNGKYITLRAYDNNKKQHIKFWWIVFGKSCDHINHNTFDNRKKNLRECTFGENKYNTGVRIDNTSSITGVCFNKFYQKWYAYLNKDKQRVFTSSLYSSKEKAIRERLKAELKYFGEFSPQKHLFEQYGIEVGENNE